MSVIEWLNSTQSGHSAISTRNLKTMKKMDGLYDSALKLIGESFDTLSQKLDSPKKCFIGDGKGYCYRYEEKGIRQAILLKLARVVTGLQTIILLNEAGFLQEQASLQRILGEFIEDIYFLCFAIIYDDFTNHHKNYLDYFYLEEDAIKASKNRRTVSRKNIMAFISKHMGIGCDRSTVNESIRSLSKGYSDFLHGASLPIMELYFGSPPRFHLRGAHKSPLYEDHVEDLKNYFHRGILCFAFAALSFGEKVLYEKINKFSKEFALNSGCA